MSSILNALKKVEAESAATAKVHIQSGKLKLRQGTESRPQRSIGWAVPVFGVLLLSAGAWMVLRSSRTPSTPPVQSYRITSTPDRRPAAAPYRSGAGQKPATTYPAGHPARVPQQAPVKHSVKTPPAPAAKRTAVRASKPKKPPPSRMRPAPQPPPAAAVKNIRPQAIYKISGHGLTLQAIAWDPNPPKRFAVVNSQIVHEGQSIDGKMIGQIQRDAIIVHQGSEIWKIVFR